MDKLTWLKMKLGFDVEAAKAKKKKTPSGSTPVAPAISAAAIVATGQVAGSAGTSGGTGWQGAQRGQGTAPSSGPRMGGNRQSAPPSRPPPPPPSPPAPTIQLAENGYAPVEGLAPGGTMNPYLQPSAPEESGRSGDTYLTLGEQSGGYAPLGQENQTYRSIDDLESEQTEETEDSEETEESGNGAKTYLTMDSGESNPIHYDPVPGSPVGEPPRPNVTLDKKPARKFDTVDASNTDYAMGVQGATGMTGKSAGDEYLGEHNEAGWREKLWNVGAGDTGITTKLNTEKERSDGTLELQEDGSYKRRDGGDFEEDENIGYAMDPKTGEMATFKEDMRLSRTTESGETQRSGPLSLNAGVGGFKSGQGDLEVTHHTTALGGDVIPDDDGSPILDSRGREVKKSRAAASAGFVKFDFAGQMISISNSSGHYKPSVSMLLQAVEHLTKEGAFFEDEITDANGEAVAWNSKPGQLFAAVQAKLKKKAPLLRLAQTKTAELGQVTDGDELERIAGEIEALSQELQTLAAELEAPSRILRKLGIAPSRRIRKDAMVEISEVKAGMGGGDIRTMETTEMKVEKFLKSGGSPEQLKNKKTMLEELEEKTAGRKATLDQMADVQSRGGAEAGEAAPTEEEVASALKTLQGDAPPDAGEAEAGEEPEGHKEEEEETEESEDHEEDEDHEEGGAGSTSGHKYFEKLDENDNRIEETPEGLRGTGPTNYEPTEGTNYKAPFPPKD